MMSANYAKLRGRIREKYGRQNDFAAVLHIDRSTLSLKLNGKRDWTREEIEKSCVALDIPLADAHYYFFAV